MAIAVGLFSRKVYQLWRYLRLGKADGDFGQMRHRLLVMAGAVVGQVCQWKGLSKRDRAGLGHVFMAWGFFTFVLFYFLFIIIGQGFGVSETLEETSFFFYYAWVMDIAAVFVITGALWGLIRRYVIRPPRLEGEQTLEALVILVTVLTHPMTHLFKEATSIALGHPPAGLGASLPPISAALSNLFSNSSTSLVEAANVGFFWAHWSIVLFVLVFIGYSRYLHMIVSPFNVLFQSPPPKGALRPIDLEKAENFGASKITDFTRKQLLDLYSCVACGRCHVNCPAQLSGKRLSPREVILNLKEHLFEIGPQLLRGRAEAENGKELIGGVVTEEEIWDCTTCRACEQVCPVGIEHVAKIVDLRRHLAMEKSQLPPSAQEALQSLGTRGHPWRGTTATRTDWVGNLGIKPMSEAQGVEVLYWVGCTSALEERSTKVAQATARILQATGVKFGILGSEENCCGDPARRLGDEYLFQTLCQQNIELLKGYQVQKILTTCPHCFHSLKYEYPQFGGNFEVVHHTQFIADLMANGRLKPGGLNSQKVAYHDACYLGRYHDIYQEPRQILKAMEGLSITELARSREKSFCCGGGGGHLWMEEPPEQRVNARRVEELVEAKVDLVATACPYCLSMLEDGIKAKGLESLKALDISELVALSLESKEKKQ
ncbi:MAG: (Fe-S)-binding protein [Chloroflexota bacterium]